MKAPALICLCLLLLAGCTQKETSIPFEQEGWREMQGPDYPEREKMLADLMQHDLHGVSKDSLIRMLGLPDRSNEGYLYYKISTERIGLFPLHVKTLVFKLKADSTVAWIKVHG